jgi:hypothetical protein
MSKKGKESKSKRRGDAKRPKGFQSVDDGEDQPDASGHHGKNKARHNTKGSSRRKSSGPNSFDDDVELRDSLAVHGMEIIDISPDGNCLFRSISDQLFGDYGNNHADVRSAICDFMEKNKEDFQVFLVFEDEDDDDQQEEDAKDFEHYIDTMRQDGEWGGNLELVAAARLYQ